MFDKKNVLVESPFTAYALLFYFLYIVVIHWTIYHVKLLMLSLYIVVFSIFTSFRRVCLSKFFLFNGLTRALFIYLIQDEVLCWVLQLL
jgi:hypothetical protein